MQVKELADFLRDVGVIIFWGLFILGLMVASVHLVQNDRLKELKQQAIELGYAHHDLESGKWAWKKLDAKSARSVRGCNCRATD